jgi:hypothetical protein
MPFLCELGWHRADPLARWNHGYYFSKCGRCGRDLVRTAFAGWQVPHGFKVVWQAKPPAGTEDVQLLPEEADASPAPPPEAQPVATVGETAFSSNAIEEPVAETEATAEPEAPLDGEAAEEEVELPFGAPDDLEQETVAQEDESEPQDAEPPAEEDPVAEDEPVGETEQASSELPIQEVLRQLAEGDIPEREAAESVTESDPPPPAAAPAAPEPAPFVRAPVRRGAIPDFMSDDPGEDLLESMAEPTAREQPLAADAGLDDHQPRPHFEHDDGAAQADAEPAAVAEAPVPVVATAGEVSGATVRQKILGERDPDPGFRRRAGEGDPSASSGRARAAVTIAASFGLVMLATAMMARPGTSTSLVAPQPAASTVPAVQPPSPAAASPQPAAPAKPEAEAKGFVTASLLNCRSSPAEEAKPVRRLRRGEPVQVLAMEPAWASVSHKGRQCWASSRYISEQEPL